MTTLFKANVTDGSVAAPSPPFSLATDVPPEPTLFGLKYYIGLYVVIGVGALIVTCCLAVLLATCRRFQKRRKAQVEQVPEHDHGPAHVVGVNETSFSFPSPPDSQTSHLKHAYNRRESDDEDGDWQYGPRDENSTVCNEEDEEDWARQEMLTNHQAERQVERESREHVIDGAFGAVHMKSGTKSIGKLVDSTLSPKIHAYRGRVHSSEDTRVPDEGAPSDSALLMARFGSFRKSKPKRAGVSIPVIADQAVLRKNRKKLFSQIWGDDASISRTSGDQAAVPL